MQLFSWISLTILVWIGWNFGVRSYAHGMPPLAIVPAAGIVAALHVVRWVVTSD